MSRRAHRRVKQMFASLTAIAILAVMGSWGFAQDAKKAEDTEQAIIKAQLPNYPLDTCVVSGEKLDGKMGEPVNYVYKGQLVRFCCKGCLGAFQKDPDKYLKKIDQAAKLKAAGTVSPATATQPGHKQSHEHGTHGGSTD